MLFEFNYMLYTTVDNMTILFTFSIIYLDDF